MEDTAGMTGLSFSKMSPAYERLASKIADAIDGGAEVSFVIEGKPRRIASMERGADGRPSFKDSAGNLMGLGGLVLFAGSYVEIRSAKPQGEVTPTPTTTATGPVRPGAEPAPAPTTAAPQPKADVVAKFQKLDRMRDDVSTTRNERIKADRQGQLNQMLAQDTRLAEIDVNFVQRVAAELESQGKLKRRCP